MKFSIFAAKSKWTAYYRGIKKESVMPGKGMCHFNNSLKHIIQF